MSLKTLAELSSAPSRTIMGLMSGTSIDGLDIGVFNFWDSGFETKFEVVKYGTVEYSDEQRTILRKFATAESVNMQELCIYHAELARWHAKMIREKLNVWQMSSQDIDLIASHGQTIRHAPRRIHKLDNLPDSTFQLGDGDHLAWLTGITTISDFRQKHVAAGGEGAPLAVYGDRLLFHKTSEYRILLNIGGISNLTVLDGDSDVEKLPVSFDTGPGNTLIDYAVRTHFSPKVIDTNGDIAANGEVNEKLLKALMSNPYFDEKPPKTTGPELLSPDFLHKSLKASGAVKISPNDLVATLTAFTAFSISDAIEKFVRPPLIFKIYISGGGVHNRTLVNEISRRIPHSQILNFEQLGVHPDAKEALFFASMANELVCGNKFPVQDTTGKINLCSFGKISLAN